MLHHRIAESIEREEKKAQQPEELGPMSSWIQDAGSTTEHIANLIKLLSMKSLRLFQNVPFLQNNVCIGQQADIFNLAPWNLTRINP